MTCRSSKRREKIEKGRRQRRRGGGVGGGARARARVPRREKGVSGEEDEEEEEEAAAAEAEGWKVAMDIGRGSVACYAIFLPTFPKEFIVVRLFSPYFRTHATTSAKECRMHRKEPTRPRPLTTEPPPRNTRHCNDIELADHVGPWLLAFSRTQRHPRRSARSVTLA